MNGDLIWSNTMCRYEYIYIWMGKSSSLHNDSEMGPGDRISRNHGFMRDELTYLGPYSRCLLLLLLLLLLFWIILNSYELLFIITHYDHYYYCLLSLSLRRRDYLSQAFKEALALAFQWLWLNIYTLW